MQSPFITPNTKPPQARQTTFRATTSEDDNPQQPLTATTTTKFYKVIWLSQQQQQHNKPQSKTLSAGELKLFYVNDYSLSQAFSHFFILKINEYLRSHMVSVLTWMENLFLVTFRSFQVLVQPCIFQSKLTRIWDETNMLF